MMDFGRSVSLKVSRMAQVLREAAHTCGGSNVARSALAAASLACPSFLVLLHSDCPKFGSQSCQTCRMFLQFCAKFLVDM